MERELDNEYDVAADRLDDTPIFDELLSGYRETYPGILQPLVVRARTQARAGSRHA
ncbi:hypothetical protein QBL02_08445 [Leucobacter sp. UT-8R-CII-1-4]|uniref:hypothetical protein n=1 Tax=Leucobacter sp. UT-8R-CII-1-4 TaxID=3040075 RepID=UPI0024A9C5CE|nr:hypothetical protein [Leucobacter sp. UT-8R-CII-1-4]MDI6023572.1 hypothetical protein [Leucobacter sp. UT-8R-CII-1-4]